MSAHHGTHVPRQFITGSNTYGGILALNPDGARKWFFPTAAACSSVSSPVLGTDGTIYSEGDDGYVYALSPTGALRWQDGAALGNCEIAPWNQMSPAIDARGTILAPTLSGLTAYNPNGTIAWQFSVPGIGSSPVIGADGTIFVATYLGQVYAIGN